MDSPKAVRKTTVEEVRYGLLGLPDSRNDLSRRRKSEPQPLAQIIERFHKIREERANSRHDHIFDIFHEGRNTSVHDGKKSSFYEGRKSRFPGDHQIPKVKFNDDVPLFLDDPTPSPRRARSRRHDDVTPSPRWPMGKRDDDVMPSPRRTMGGSHGKRRVSLPSLFHPFTPTPAVTSSEEQAILDEEEEEPLPRANRRHSVAHVVTEYSKHDIEKLAKAHELKIAEMNEEFKRIELEKKREKEAETEFPRWLTGKELHAFYNGWENGGKSLVKRPAPVQSRYLTPHMASHGHQTPRNRINSF